jgi:uncharacterized protein YgbK (DUF1537 family)
MSKLLLTFYADDFTGATDALEQLTLAGVRTMLFLQPPTPAQLRKFPGLHALGVAGRTRALAPAAMGQELKPVWSAFRRLHPRHVHYKVCSTFDSSPKIGSIGCVMDGAAKIFPGPFISLLVAAPALGRYTVFGQHFARYGIGSAGAIHRLDRHPAISKHPVTPMTEADLRRHLAKQTKKRIALFDLLNFARPDKEFRAAFRQLLAEKPDVVLFDALSADHLVRIGGLLDSFADGNRALFSVGSSGIEAALAAKWAGRAARPRVQPDRQVGPTNVLVGSGSCSPVTSGQIVWALKHGFAQVRLDAAKLVNPSAAAKEVERAAITAAKLLPAGRSVIVHSTKNGSDKAIAAKLKGRTAEVLGTALGKVLREVIRRSGVRRVCIAGGDTSSYAARVLGIEAWEMIAPLTPGAPLGRAHAPGSPADGGEIVFKGGQVGAENYFEVVRRGRVEE